MEKYFSGYVQELLEEVFLLRQQYPSYSKAMVLDADHPPPLTESMDCVDKDELVARYISRYGEDKLNASASDVSAAFSQ